MLNEILYWISGLTPAEITGLMISLLVLDVPRYAVTNLTMVLIDIFRIFKKEDNTPYFPSVSVIIAGYNEEEVIEKALTSVYGAYPNMQLIVVDDGSTDSTYSIASNFARLHPDVIVLRRENRGGKGSALNIGYHYAINEIVVCLDADSEFSRSAIFNIVQPFKDPTVGVVSGGVHIRNKFKSLCTWFQAYEYLCSIQVGRLLSSRLGMLSMASGAFGAYRKTAIDRGFGWDASVGEDIDLTLRARKAGWNVVFTSEAECFTEGPVKFYALGRQRLRWDRSYVRYEVRKHNGIASLFWNNFRLSSFCYWYEQFLFNVVLTLAFWITLPILIFTTQWESLKSVTLLLVFFYSVFSLLNVLIVMFYSKDLKRDFMICMIFPFYIFYALFLRCIRMYAFYQEFILKASYEDKFVPDYVQKRIRKTLGKF